MHSGRIRELVETLRFLVNGDLLFHPDVRFLVSASPASMSDLGAKRPGGSKRPVAEGLLLGERRSQADLLASALAPLKNAFSRTLRPARQRRR